MPRGKVRTHTVIRDGKPYTRHQHTRKNKGGRRADGMKLRPGRAWGNAKRAHMSLKHRKRLRAGLFATAAVTEIAAFTVFRGVGGVLAVAGLGVFLLGVGLKART